MIARLAALLLATAAAAAPPPAQPAAPTTKLAGLLPVEVDAAGGRVLVTLPPPGPDGVSGRFLYAASLRTGIGSASIGLDHAQSGEGRILVFRRLGRKVAAEFENPRFRATGAPPAEQAAARHSFATTTLWLGDVAAVRPDGGVTVDLSGMLTRDVLGVADALKQGGGGSYRLSDALSAADVAATRVFPDNVELEARQTFVSDDPQAEIQNIAPDARQVTVAVRHSLIRLPEPGFRPRRLDMRSGAFGSQAVDYAAPLGQPVVYDLANRFRLEKLDPAAPRSRVKKPIVFHIDRAAPEPIRTALAEGVGWWARAFDAAGYIDAFQVAILPEGADPLDVRYNVVNWVNRATRGWSYGLAVADPRTGEIVKGAVMLGSLRVRQDMMIFQGLVGAGRTGAGGPNDPVQAALARIRQLGAHEVGHALGFEHNFAASSQDRYSVMDYPAPRIGLDKDGAPDLSDAYGVGVGPWDMFAVDWLYGADDDATGARKAAAAEKAGLRFAADPDGRPVGSAHRYGAIWDDGPDAAAELNRMMQVRRAAVTRFGPAALMPGEPAAELRRKFVPIWLLHRYQVEAAAKLIGGYDFAYGMGGEGRAATPVPAADQARALDALLATLSAEALRVPPALVPQLSAGRIGSYDRQFAIELFQTAGGPVFDPLAAADAAARVTLDALLNPERLARLTTQHAADPAVPDAARMAGLLVDRTLAQAGDPLGRRIAYRTLVSLAAASHDPATAPEVAAELDGALTDAVARLAKGRDAWSRGTARLLGDQDRLTALLAEQAKRAPKVPPGMPIGSGESDWMGD